MTNNSDFFLCLILVAVGFVVVHSKVTGLHEEAAAALAGAVFGGAALLLGNWINRRNERHRAEAELGKRRQQVHTLITAELVSLGAGLLGSREFIDSAIETANAQGYVHTHCDLTALGPRAMPLTDNLGVELLVLEPAALDALTTLRSNLAITRAHMDAITEGRAQFERFSVTTIAKMLRDDMGLLAEVFGLVARTRQWTLPDGRTELATVLLKRESERPLPGTET